MIRIYNFFKKEKKIEYSNKGYVLPYKKNKDIQLTPKHSDSSFEATNLLTPYRFDVMAKFIFAKFNEKQINSDWHKKLYVEHLKVWNNLKEKGKTNDNYKDGEKTFIDSFQSLIKNIKENNFDKEKSKIWINKDGNLVNGGHRLATCLLYNKNLFLEIKDKNVGQADCSSYYFLNRTKYTSSGLSENTLDAMALNYAKIKKNTFIVTVFPKALGHHKKIKKILNSYGKLVYDKQINFTKTGAFNYIKLLYDGEKWLGNWKNCFYGVNAKLKLCYKKNSLFRVYLFECTDLKKTVAAKEKIRKIFNIDKNSIHINDTHKETIITAEAIFNKNSIHHLNHSKLYKKKYFKFVKLFNEFKDTLKYYKIDKEDVCVDASSILSVYGLREGKDIDFLHNKQINFKRKNKLISSHNSSAHYYNKSIDDIIYNNENHFYFEGIKFTTPQILKNLKENRGEKKDINDLKLLNKII